MSSKKCFVPGCGNTSLNNPEKLFISVPNNYDVKKKWFDAVKCTFKTTRQTYCCEDHFDIKNYMENYIQHKLMKGKIRMRKGVVPHKCLKQEPHVDIRLNIPCLVSRKRSFVTEHEMENVKRQFNFVETTAEPEPSCSSSFGLPFHDEVVNVISPSGCLQETEIDKFTENIESNSAFLSTVNAVETANKATQVNLKHHFRSVGINVNLKIEAKDLIPCQPPVESPVKTISSRNISRVESFSSPSSVTTTSGSFFKSSTTENDSTVDGYCDKYDLDAYVRRSNYLMKEKARFYLGLPEETYFLINLISKHISLPPRNILICLKKIRLDDSFSRLSDDFGVSVSYISNIFRKTIPLLASVFKKFIFWQSADVIQYHLPIPFRFRYKNVQCIIDCLEIEVEIPSDPVKQAHSWSQYKKANTLKYLISATPHGFINFISKGFGGRVTDVVLVANSGFLEVVPQEAHIMADRGFKQIAGLLATKKIVLVRPPSVNRNEKSSKLEVKESKRIAALRIHIERVIRRLREFKMLKLHSCINHNFLHLYDHIIIIACGTVNTQDSIISQ